MALKIVEFFTGFTSETQPNLTSIEAERLGTYANDAAYVSAKGSAAAEGDAYGNTTDNTIHYYNGSAWVSIASITYVDNAIDTDIATHAALTATHGVSGDIVGTSDSQTLTNKTLTSPDVNTPDIDGGTINDVDFDGGTASNTSRVTLPKAATATLEGLDRKEGTIFFDSTEKKFYGDDGTEVISLGGGAGGASIEVEQSTHGFDVLDAIYFDESDDTWYLAQANSVDTVATHIVVEDTDTDNFICASSGRWEITSHGAAEGYHFVSTTTAGATVTTEPTSGVSNPAFHAVTDDYIDVYTGYRPNLIGDGVASDSEVGIIMSFAGTSVPTGFLACEGQAVSRSVYAELFSKISTTWGSGDGSTTFNLPDGRSGFLVGAGQGEQSEFTVKTNRNVGDYNPDAFQGHRHGQDISAWYFETGTPTHSASATNLDMAATNPLTLDPITDGVNGTPRTGTETVPNSLAVKFIIRYSPKAALQGVYSPEIVYLKDVKPTTTAGGTFTSGAWQTRTLNTTENSQTWCSLSSNQFTLSAGKYRIRASAPTYQVQTHQTKLRNITDSTNDIIGTCEFSDTSSNCGTRSHLVGIIEIASSKTFEIQHYCNNTVSPNGFGVNNSFGLDEVYTQVEIEKLDI